ncbi:MAG: MBL fold metallo-hydrolase [Desulfovibrionaceae bacterium]|nr:MBL fold metallo-hydrolase [Desulfovibrionaceae bacterium]
MPVLTFPFGPLEANAYLLHNERDAVVADPPDDPARVLRVIRDKGLTLRAIVLTHLHFDHAGGCAAMSGATGLPVLVGSQDWELRDVLLSGPLLFGQPPIPAFEAEALAPGPIPAGTWGSLDCTVLHAPGHSPGSLCYYFPEEKALLAGDVIFYRSVGRSDLPGGDFDTLCRSLRRVVYTLPEDTVIYPGHGERTTVGIEAAFNPICPA